MLVFTSLMNLTDEQGNIGSYAEQIETVREVGSIEVPVRDIRMRVSRFMSR